MFGEPRLIETEVFARVPATLRKAGRCPWGDANNGRRATECFLEGPVFDAAGNLYVTDIPYGRILRVDPAGRFEVIAEWDGWPNGLKLHRDGRLFIADYRHGILACDPATGKVTEVITHRHSESFKGVNDLHFADNGDLWFTDQGQTGLHDPTGRVYRYTAAGQLTCMINTVPSPNGLVLDLHEKVCFVAVTRANAVWRMPIMPDGAVSKVGVAVQLSGGLSGPDGLALDEEGGLVVAHAGMGCWRFDRLLRPTHFIEPGVGLFVTNIAFKGRRLYMTESESGTILVADLPAAGKTMYGLS